MIKKIQRLFGMNIIQWVKNVQVEYSHLEAEKYLLVESSRHGQMLFTQHQVEGAKKRARKNQADVI